MFAGEAQGKGKVDVYLEIHEDLPFSQQQSQRAIMQCFLKIPFSTVRYAFTMTPVPCKSGRGTMDTSRSVQNFRTASLAPENRELL